MKKILNMNVSFQLKWNISFYLKPSFYYFFFFGTASKQQQQKIFSIIPTVLLRFGLWIDFGAEEKQSSAAWPTPTN